MTDRGGSGGGAWEAERAEGVAGGAETLLPVYVPRSHVQTSCLEAFV